MIRCGFPGCPTPAAVNWQRALGSGDVGPVYACAEHSISLEAAALLHAVTCPAPGPDVPTPCCTPLTTSDPGTGDEPGPLNPLPPGWT